MEVSNRSTYSTNIYIAVVVNTDTTQDPSGKNRVQIYIPSTQYDYESVYQDYMNDSDKTNSEYFSVFPWATSLVSDLVAGHIVYGSFIENSTSNFIILGLDEYNDTNKSLSNTSSTGTTSSDGSAYSVSGGSLLEITMPIILNNEVGISVSDYPDGISDSYYQKINPYDNGGWSIGLIQWHESRAYDLLLYIAKNNEDWKSDWTATSSDLYTCLCQGESSSRTKFGSSFHPTSGTALYTSIQNMMSSEKGKTYHLEYAKKDTDKAITNLTDDYGISNPAVIIFVADIMNQYGYYVTKTKAQAASICSSSDDMMDQLDSMISWCKSNLGSYSTYESRRNKTITYIKQLYEAGALNTAGLADEDMGEASSAGFVFPVAGGCKDTWINCKTYPSYYDKNGKPHTGVDINRNGSGGSPNGKTVIAAAAGKVIVSKACMENGTYSSYGEYVVIDHQNGLCTAYGHLTANSRKVAVGDTVVQGQALGTVGSTGNSTGPHLHFEVRKGSNQLYNSNAVNPLPYLP